jgi:hypothetical protein
LKLVREHINEKFEEESDPIADMGIGIENQIKKWATKYIRYEPKWTKDWEDLLVYSIDDKKLEFIDYLLNVKKVDPDAPNRDAEIGSPLRWACHSIYGENSLKMCKMLIDAGANPKYVNTGSFLYNRKSYGEVDKETYNFLVDEIIKWKRAHSKKLTEKFEEESDPITDMAIGIMSKEELRDQNFINVYTGADLLEIKKIKELLNIDDKSDIYLITSNSEHTIPRQQNITFKDLYNKVLKYVKSYNAVKVNYTKYSSLNYYNTDVGKIIISKTGTNRWVVGDRSAISYFYMRYLNYKNYNK